VRPDATYLITGGLAGLGLLTAEWMAGQGARHLLLVGRRAPGAAAQAALSRIEAMGVRVETRQADVADRAAMADLLRSTAATMPPLRGVVHSAGVLRDGVLLGQEWSRFAEVMAPKVDGAWNLHALTLGRPLDFFVMFSSVAGLIGSSAQANHAAANAFLDALAHERRARGWPALSINWGVWSEVGSAAERQAGDRVRLQGVGTIAPAEGLRMLDSLLSSRRVQAAVLPVDWDQYLRQFRGATPAWLSEVGARARTKPGTAQRGADAAPAGPSFLERLLEAPATRQLEAVEAHVMQQVAAVIGLDPGRPMDPEQPLNEIGLDSLMAVELRNRLSATLALERGLPATLVFDYPTVTAIARYLLVDVLHVAPPDAAPAATAAGDEDVLSAIEGLSDDAVERMLSREV
jgi:NAD(P)-dependent dehydrogenase (short-subunit alcohol dehydrogenase family)